MEHLDRIDVALLTQLVENARMTHVELSERIHLSPSAVARRQRALEETGIINGYTALLAAPKLGFAATAVVQIRLNTQNERALADFEEAVRFSDRVLQCFLLSGDNDYLLILAIRDLGDFDLLHKNLLARLPGVAQIQSSFVIRQVVSRHLLTALHA